MAVIKICDHHSGSKKTKAVVESTLLDTLHTLIEECAPAKESEKIYIEVINEDEVTELRKPISRDIIYQEVTNILKEFPLDSNRIEIMFSDDCTIEVCQALRSMHICHRNTTGIHLYDEGEDSVIIKGCSPEGKFDQSISFLKDDITSLCEWLQEL